MIFLGIDFGWVNKPSGRAVMHYQDGALQLVSTERRTDIADIAAWVEEQAAGGPAMIGVDAPIVIRSATGMRDADKEAHSLFGKYHAGCYPANLGRPFAARTLALSAALQQQGFAHSDAIVARQPGRYQIEVHPHAASVMLFGLGRILKYKKGPLAERLVVMKQYRRLLAVKLSQAEPRLEKPKLPMIPSTGKEMKAVEDQLDAVMCAYIGAPWWYWGRDRNYVLGRAAGRYLIVLKPTSTFVK